MQSSPTTIITVRLICPWTAVQKFLSPECLSTPIVLAHRTAKIFETLCTVKSEYRLRQRVPPTVQALEVGYSRHIFLHIYYACVRGTRFFRHIIQLVVAPTAVHSIRTDSSIAIYQLNVGQTWGTEFIKRFPMFLFNDVGETYNGNPQRAARVD